MSPSNDRLEFHTRRSVEATTVWLHGQGADSEDLIPILKNLTGSRELGLRYLAPNAPMRRLRANGNRPGRAWYDMAASESDEPDAESLNESHNRLTELLDTEQQAMPTSRTLIGGFSQGGAMALHTGLQYPRQLAGIIVLSGELLDPETLSERIHTANAQTPILMIHGEEDELIPVEEARENRDTLRGLGLQVDWHELPLAHEISMDTVEIVDQWIQARLKEQGVTGNRDD
ncbi:phospholipase/carboxylesterase [Halospina denitrificans]|uniref:Phospholipase/carboxylesterase n=1 Tax=Halospina denitrificans TaxID=332522 RepID=A0A4V3EQ32_9GAMM|nr:alpha/beta hydrolase-fold protein [Halospina denitrificans]TDT40168.1 phospholipase/carboxylesterase [Halospina denitrificans]